MFEVRNEAEIWYKADEMPEWVHFGLLRTASPSEKENEMVVQKFDFEKEKYAIDTVINSYEYNGTIYDVVNGYFTIKVAEEEIGEPTDAKALQEEMLSNQEGIAEQNLIIMEAIATQYEEQQEKDLNNAEVQATIYEAILELGGNL